MPRNVHRALHCVVHSILGENVDGTYEFQCVEYAKRTSGDCVSQEVTLEGGYVTLLQADAADGSPEGDVVGARIGSCDVETGDVELASSCLHVLGRGDEGQGCTHHARRDVAHGAGATRLHLCRHGRTIWHSS